jgi:hypothetical protein
MINAIPVMKVRNEHCERLLAVSGGALQQKTPDNFDPPENQERECHRPR